MNKTTAIQLVQLRQLMSVSKVSLVASVMLALLLAYIEREVIASEVIITWLSLVLLLSLLRLMVIFAYQRRAADDDAVIHARLMTFRLVILVSAVGWGSAGFLLFPPGHSQYQLFLIFALAGMTAGGVVSFSADFASAAVFSVSMILPVTVRLFAAGDSLSATMGAATILYIGFLVMSAWRICSHVRENITLHLEAGEREEKVRASEESYRLLLSHLPVGVFHYNTDLVVTYCNTLFAKMLDSTRERIIGLDMKRTSQPATLPALKKALQGELGEYEGHYHVAGSEKEKWLSMSCAPFRDGHGIIGGGIAIVQDITQRKMAEDEIKSLAFYDHLTSLPNRRLLLDRLRQAMASGARSGKSCALLFIDLDNFKVLNDTLGHDVGDALLQQVAQRLTACVREGDSVARLGGDEFVVMLEGMSHAAFEAAEQTELVGEKILRALSEPYQLGLHECRSTPSIGATLFTGHQQAVEELLKQADIAMYQAKKAGRNTMRFFDQQMQLAVTARAALEAELRKAAPLRQFHLHYQIQVDEMCRPIGAEALVRWQHPRYGLLPPGEFIPVAEETDLILDIGKWVLDEGCAQIRAWQQHDHTRDLVLALNVSAIQFFQADFVAQVQAAIQRYSINPRLLKLELTESALLENIEDTVAAMAILRRQGVQFSLDDFGSGYSSLQYLKRLPIDQLKIDQSFIRDIVHDANCAAIVRTIVAIAQSLNLGVIAEGVETEAQWQLLSDHGCVHYQGDLFGKPLPLPQFEMLLEERRLVGDPAHT